MSELTVAPPFGDQLEMLIAFNDQQREAMLWKLEGLADAQLRQPHAVTGFSLLALVKHLIRVERTWFQHRLAGEDVAGEPNDATAWVPEPDETFDVLSGQYKAAWARSNEIARSMPLESMTAIPSATFGPVSLQWVLFHMIEETARHLGHADIIRQSIDGATGVSPALANAPAPARAHGESDQHER